MLANLSLYTVGTVICSSLGTHNIGREMGGGGAEGARAMVYRKVTFFCVSFIYANYSSQILVTYM